jgi:predicted nucleic acid-binding protein
VSIVLDASVVAKLLVEEPGSAEARALVAEMASAAAPDLLVAEVGNMLWRRVRAGTTPRDAVAELLRIVPAIVADLHPLRPLGPAALRIAVQRDHPIYDCFYLALAQREGLPLATADRRLARLAEAEGVEVRLIGPAPGAALP